MKLSDAIREAVAQERIDAIREREQRSAAEVPGFAARTTIDDTIGKLFAIRQQLKTPVPEGLSAILDDIEALTEQAADIALDPDAPELDDPTNSPPYKRAELDVSGSKVVGFCSCGSPTVCGA